MGHHHHHHHERASKDSHGIASSIRDIWKAYKSLVSKRNIDKNTSNKKKAEEKSMEINVLNATTMGAEGAYSDTVNLQNGKNPNDNFKKSCSFLSRSSSRRSQTPIQSKPCIAKSASISASRSDSTSTQILRSKSTRNDSRTSTFSGNLREVGSIHREGHKTDINHTRRLSRNVTRAGGPTPIVFSYSTELKKPPPTEKSLGCTLEELCYGCIKKIVITRNVMSTTGQLHKEEETLRIKVKPGWKKGTQIKFEGKGDERPGTHPADIIFTIHEEKHSLFKKNGDDLEVELEIPLLKALTSCSLSVPLLGGENMDLSIDSVIHPGFETTIHGQGMPKSNEGGERGDLHVKFLVTFPTDLSADQRKEAYSILKDCC